MFPARRQLNIVSYGEKNGPLSPSPTFSYNLCDLPNPPREVRVQQRRDHNSTVIQQWLLSHEAFRGRIDDARQEILEFVKIFDKVGSPPECEVTVGVGCQLGRHRSVTFANELARQLMVDLEGKQAWQVTVVHRDKNMPKRSRGVFDCCMPATAAF